MRKFRLTVLIAFLLPLAGNAQIKVNNNGQTIIGGGAIPASAPSLWIKGGFNPSPSPAMFDLGTVEQGKIRFSEISTGSRKLNIHADEGTSFSGKFGTYMSYVPLYSDASLLNIDSTVITSMKQLYVNNSLFAYNIYYYNLEAYSDERFKRDITPLQSGSLSRLSKLNGVTYKFDFSKSPLFGGQPTKGDDGKDLAIPEDTVTQIGFIAQELRKVFPQLVKEDKEGYLSVNYVGLIPVIIEALKEQQAHQEALNKAQSAKITELQAELNALREGTVTPKAKGAAAIDAFLYQNAPNPFNIATTIRYFLSSEVANASLYIFDLQGRLVNTYPIGGAGEGSVEISASGLQPAMYLYSLIVNGQEVDTKRMVITE